MRSPQQTIRHLKRYREIVQVFLSHGLGELVDLLELQPYLALPRRMVRGLRSEESAPPLSIPQRLRLTLEELGPTFIKLGQALSTRPDLVPPAYIKELAKLQDTVPPEPWDPIKAQIEDSLDASLEDRFAQIDPEPLAAASLAQVHAATLPDGSDVVVKVQRPDIETTINIDLEIMQDWAQLLQTRIPLGEIYDLPEIAREFANTLRSELDFYREGYNADRFRKSFADERYLHIPKVYWELTTRRVLVMERIRGIKIDNIEALDRAGYDRHRIAVHAAQMIIKEVLEDGFFHADPHPGNFVVMEGEVIGAMDFGMVGHLSQRTRNDLSRLYVAAIQMDEESIVDQMIRMGVVGGSTDRKQLQRDLNRLLRKYYGLPLKAIRAQEIIADVTPIAFRHHLRLPPELWLLGKTLAMMEGVGLKIDPNFDFVSFSRPYIRRFIWRTMVPERWGATLLKNAGAWSDLMKTLPRIGTRLLNRTERGDLEIVLRHKELDQALIQLDRLTNRLSLSLLLAALIVGLALLVPAFNLAEQLNLATVLVVTGFIGASLLGVWLIFSIWRSRK